MNIVKVQSKPKRAGSSRAAARLEEGDRQLREGYEIEIFEGAAV